MNGGRSSRVLFALVAWVAQAASPGDLTVTFPEETRLQAPDKGGRLLLRSAPVKLEVGRLYHLSAQVETRDVRVDPAARYPTALGACLSMESFPFTNASPSLAATRAETLSVTFFATRVTDRVQLHLGRNGAAWGQAIFKNVRLAPADIGSQIPLERVRWSGPGFRYEERGWTYVHVEGEPYTRGRQYGTLVAEDLARFLGKLAVSLDAKNPEEAWNRARAETDALFLRKYDPEFLEEMKGIADAAAAQGAKVYGRAVDLLDVVTANSSIDLSYLNAALRVTPHALSGRTFTRMDEQAAGAPERDKCSSFVATQNATTDGRPVLMQMFMWGTYTGVEWNVIVDLVPAQGHRLVYQTFPGGISSGADWYMNDAGLVIGETTVGQTPWNSEGAPQSNRIRKAAQYAASIDTFTSLLRAKNNGLYTNEWILADMKTGEGADYLLGTAKDRLWRTGSPGHPADTPGHLKDFIWANNNNRDLEVRKETAQQGEDWPVDLAFNTWDRDIAFWRFYQRFGQGKIDVHAGMDLMASSPVNRPHACDGKITTGEMASQLMFHAHHGKTTLREKMPGGRYVDAALPNFQPQLTYGYATFSPIWVAQELQAAKARISASKPRSEPPLDLGECKDQVGFPNHLLWKQTVFPASETDFWMSSGNAAYHDLLRRLPEPPDRAYRMLRDQLQDLNQRYLVLARREGAEAPGRTPVAFDRFGSYVLPRAKGLFMFHQLRLALGNARFARGMAAVHQAYALRPMGRAAFEETFSKAVQQDIRPWVAQWIDRTDLPNPQVRVRREGAQVVLTVRQEGQPWHAFTTVEVHSAQGTKLHRVEIQGPATELRLPCGPGPGHLIFNAGQDLLTEQPVAATQASLSDDFSHLRYVWGSGESVEAARTLALGFRDAIADATTEVLPPLTSDGETSPEMLADADVVLLGGMENTWVARLAAEKKLPLELGKGWFRFQDQLHARPDEGFFVALPNPWNPRRFLHVYLANSPLQFWRMTRAYPRGLSSWALWRGNDIVQRGSHIQPAYTLSWE